MKQLFLFSLSLLAITGLYAQKKTSTGPHPTPADVKKDSKTTASATAAKPAATNAVFTVNGTPEEFKKLTADARSNYDAGRLDDSRFALQQMLTELDMIIGKEVLKALPATMMEKPAVSKADNVNGASGFFGVIIHREYGVDNSMGSGDSRNVNIEIISNSPLIASINSLLSIPLIGNSGDNKVIKVAGYKALLTKTSGSNNEVDYDLQLPLGNSLLTLKAPGATQDQVAQMAGSLPVQTIAKMLQ